VVLTPEFFESLRVFDSYFNELRYPTELVKVEGLGQEEGSILDELASVVRSYAAGGG